MYRKYKNIPSERVSYLKALLALLKVDRTKGEDAVFNMRDAMLYLDGGASKAAYDTFIKQGGFLFLSQVLSNISYLESLPSNSLGAHYLKHVSDGEKDKIFGLSSVLYQEPESSMEHFFARQVDVHDLVHVVMGYGKERLGEACVVGAYSNYYKSWRVILFAMIARNIIRRRLFRPKRMRDVWRTIYVEPRLRASSVNCWDLIHWERYLAYPIEDVRKKLGIPPSKYYDTVRKKFLSEGGV